MIKKRKKKNYLNKNLQIDFTLKKFKMKFKEKILKGIKEN